MSSNENSMEALEKEEKLARSKNHYQEIEEKWEQLIELANGRQLLTALKRYNLFRLRNLLVLKKKRPALLLGYINDFHFPNFHTYELLKVADVVSLTTSEKEPKSKDRVYYFPSSDDFTTIRKKLPKGFKPQLFWDMQAAHGHMHPLGLSTMPFPTVAGICHHQHGPAVKTICEMFDYVLPISQTFSPSCSYQNAKVLNLPFGLNWASFHKSIPSQKAWESRKFDISITFSNTASQAYHGLRNEVIQEIENFKSKWAEKYTIETAQNLSRADYKKLLENSKISINVVAINGPYNYRTCEVINSGALLFQANVIENGLKLSFDNGLDIDKDFVAFTPQNLEQKLIHFLDNPKQAFKIAENAKQRIKNKFSYDKLFKNLLASVEKFDLEKLKTDSQVNNDKFLLGKFLWQQHQNQDVQLLGSAFLGNYLSEEKDTILFFSNTLAILPEIMNSLGFNFLKSLVAKHSSSLAESLDKNNLKQIAVQLLSVKMDNIAMWYNFTALSMDFDWSPKEVLKQIVDQAFNDKEWEGFSSVWLLRVCSKFQSKRQEEFEEIRYKSLFLPLMKCTNYKDEWTAYRNFIVSLTND
jgi:hypothetical protein